MNWPFIVRQVRKSKRFSQESLAAVLGTSQTTISRWETGLQRPERLYQSWLMAQLRESDPIPSDRLVLSTLRNSLFQKSLVNRDMKFVEFSKGMKQMLGARITSIESAYITDVMPDHLKDELHRCFRNMTKSNGDIFSVSHFGPGYILKNKKFCKTFSVLKIDGLRFILCEDVITHKTLTKDAHITIKTFDDVL